jgi:predicted nucleic acid-binding protein
LPAVDIDVELRDRDDVAVVASALAGNPETIVTEDRVLLDEPELRAWLGERGIEVDTPKSLLARLT